MRPRSLLLLVLLTGACALGAIAVFSSAIPLPLRLALLLLALLLLLFPSIRLLRWLLWSVGRKLTVSYILIGVVPLPLLALILSLTVYVAAGTFLGHVYRDAVSAMQDTADRAAMNALAAWRRGAATSADVGDGFAAAYYRDGHRVAGSPLAPSKWPAWLLQRHRDDPAGIVRSPFVALYDGTPALVGAAASSPQPPTPRTPEWAVLTLAGEGLEGRLSEATDSWIQLLRSDDPRKKSNIRISVGGRSFSLVPAVRSANEAATRARFFGASGPEATLFRRPWIWWGELTRDFRALADGKPVAEYIAASLNAAPATVYGHLTSGSTEVNTSILAALMVISAMLASLYLVAVAMAIYLIVGLSRAVNRLSRATDAVRAGDFSVRIPARRSDQIGELQQTFNEMTEGLEKAVATRAHQEALESELDVARRLQESLLPASLPASESLEFATLFEPSAAIGGDYFDVLRLDDDRVAVVIADVSGHGLPAGLRMAMLKATLNVLVEEHKSPEELLGRLDAMVRSERPRYFITCTVSIVDFRVGRLEVTNAGHPPTYRIRDGAVDEILVTGSPLGALGNVYGRREVELRPGDTLVWLSDGLIEATDDDGEVFGYERIEQALAGHTPDAAAVRDRLLAAIAAHAAGHAPDDDRTLVVLRYRGTPDIG